MTMKKGIGYVQLLDGPVQLNSKGENDPDSRKLDDWTKSVNIVKAIMVFKALCNKPGFEPLYSAI
jgi:hypothetical protein